MAVAPGGEGGGTEKAPHNLQPPASCAGSMVALSEAPRYLHSEAEDCPPGPLAEGTREGRGNPRAVGRTETLTCGSLCRDASCSEKGCSGDWPFQTAC